MPLHFAPDEFDSRLRAIRGAISRRGLDGILLFAPESHFYLTGYDTFGFALFQCMVVTQKGDIHLLTRAPDLRQAQQTSTLSDEQIHIWKDIEGTDPFNDLKNLLGDLGLANSVMGIETRTVGLTAYNGQKLAATLEGYIELHESSDLVAVIRRTKSPRELEYHRKAAELSDDALEAGLLHMTAGGFEGDILAAMQGAVFSGGGDYAGNEFVIGSGESALLCRYQSGRRHLDKRDQLTIEWAGAYRRYHAAMMRTVIIGEPFDIQRRMHETVVEALHACETAIKPGKPMGDVFDAHARVFDDRGLSHARLNACGYGMGAIYNPIWVDYPMFYEGNPTIMRVGNVFFLHMILMDSEAGVAMCWGHSVEVVDDGIRRLSRSSLDLIERV
ncbi:MAG: Xaa-Pro peptidase family protein [Pseudomonadota bacterium]